MLRCTLQDDGVGMSQEQQNSLFKLYIRGLHTKHLTRIALGLYQCRRIIQAHGGERLGLLVIREKVQFFGLRYLWLYQRHLNPRNLHQITVFSAS